jgi:site-specific DNA recombinase
MSKINSKATRPTLSMVRCAIYTRKSTEEGLQQEFNSLDAQRESAEAYISSQQHEGWVLVQDRYDDGGFTGGNMDRPALKRLLEDIEAKRIDCVIVYKVDRLSRSLLDFARLIEIFDRNQVAFVSVTQQFNTANSMGRLMLNVLLSFAQFERELISERTRDKIAASRRKGKWAGGSPILGYDVDTNSKLIINEHEAVRVRKIFDLYLEHHSLLPVVQELNKRGWVNKQWTTKSGIEKGGKAFDRTSLYRLLTNVAYQGKVKYKDEVHPGEHLGILTPEVWSQTQKVLQRNGSTAGAPVRNKFGALLKGLIRCQPCGCLMTPSHTAKRGKRYRYYTCTKAQKRGWDTCPSKSIPAHEIEQFIVDRIRCIGRDPDLLQATLGDIRSQDEARIAELESEQRELTRDQDKRNAEIKKLMKNLAENSHTLVVKHLSELQEALDRIEQRLAKVNAEIKAIEREMINENEVREVLGTFDPIWESLTPAEQGRIIGLLVQRVDYDGANNKVAITFHATGIRTLSEELACELKEMRA